MNAFNNKRNFFRVAKDKSLSFLLLLLASCTSIPVTNRSGRDDSQTIFKKEESYIRPYHHLPDGTFRNPEGSIEREDYEFPWFKFTKERMAVKVKIPEDHVVPKDTVLTSLAALENEDTITWIGHVTFLIRIGGKTIITDPFFSPNAGPLALGPKWIITVSAPDVVLHTSISFTYIRLADPTVATVVYAAVIAACPICIPVMSWKAISYTPYLSTITY